MSRTNRERKFQETKVPGQFRSGERKFQGARRPIRSEWAKERKFQGANWPMASPIGRFAPGSEKAVNRLNRVPSYCGCYRSMLINIRHMFTYGRSIRVLWVELNKVNVIEHLYMLMDYWRCLMTKRDLSYDVSQFVINNLCLRLS